MKRLRPTSGTRTSADDSRSHRRESQPKKTRRGNQASLVALVAVFAAAVLVLVVSLSLLGGEAEPAQDSVDAGSPSAAAPEAPAAAEPSTTSATTIATTTTLPQLGAGTTRYTFPIRPPEAGSFSPGGHAYPATDIFATCGTEVVSPVDGVVQELSRTDTWDPNINDGATRGGLSVSIVGDDGVRYYGSHFAELEPDLNPGDRVAAGMPIGTVGRTGSARNTPCHLHFGISPQTQAGDWEIRRGALWPEEYLTAWNNGEQLSPVDAVAALDGQPES